MACRHGVIANLYNLLMEEGNDFCYMMFMGGNKWKETITLEKRIRLSWMSNQTLSNGNILFIPFLALKFYKPNTPLEYTTQ